MCETHEHQMSLDARIVDGPEAATDNLTNAIAMTGWLAAGMLHDFRNPLGTIRSVSEILLDGDIDAAQLTRSFMTAPAKIASGRYLIFSETPVESQSLSRDVSANRSQSTGLFPFEMTTCTENRGPLTLFSDHDLIRLTLNGQTDCFTVLMDRHLSAIKSCVGFLLHGGGSPEDLTQEIVLKAWRFLSTFRAESSFRTWVIRVAINEVRQFQRRDRVSRFEELANPESLVSRDESPYACFARIQRTEAVRAVVKSLPATYREVVILRELEDLTMLEIAERLHCTIPAVKSRLFRGRSLLLAGFQKSQLLRSVRSPRLRDPVITAEAA